jgi:hypothetical protein
MKEETIFSNNVPLILSVNFCNVVKCSICDIGEKFWGNMLQLAILQTLYNFYVRIVLLQVIPYMLPNSEDIIALSIEI